MATKASLCFELCNNKDVIAFKVRTFSGAGLDVTISQESTEHPVQVTFNGTVPSLVVNGSSTVEPGALLGVLRAHRDLLGEVLSETERRFETVKELGRLK